MSSHERGTEISSSGAIVEKTFELREKPKNLHEVFQICLITRKLPEKYLLDASRNLKLNIPDQITLLLSWRFHLYAEKFIRMLTTIININVSTIKQDIKLAIWKLHVMDINVDDLDFVDYLNLWKYWYPCAPEDYCDFKTFDLIDTKDEFTKFKLCESCMTVMCHGIESEEIFHKLLKVTFERRWKLIKFKMTKFQSCLSPDITEIYDKVNDVSRPKLKRDPRSLHHIFHLIYFCKRLKGKCQESLLKQLLERLPTNILGLLTDGMRKHPRFAYRNFTRELDETNVLVTIKNYLNEYYDIDDSKWIEFDEAIKILYWKKWYLTTRDELCDFIHLYVDDGNISDWSKYRLCEICFDSLMTTQYSGKGILSDLSKYIYEKTLLMYEEMSKSWHERVFPEKTE